MQHSDEERALALAGLLQAVQLVQQVAQGKPRDTQAMETCISSIFKLEADSALEVYGNPGGLRTGLRLVKQHLSGALSGADLELSRYAIAVLHLERKLSQQTQMLQQIGTGIQLALSEADNFSLVDPRVIARLAEIYQQTLSTLQPRILVQGDQAQLAIPENANWIRALLLAAMRSAVLWHQAGGRRWKLLFSRSRLIRAVEHWQQLEARSLH